MFRFGRKPKSLTDVWRKHLAGPNTAPRVRIPKANKPRSFPTRTTEFTPIKQSRN